MGGGLAAIAGLILGVLLAFAGGEALNRGVRALLAGVAGLAAFLAVLASAAPEYAFALRAAFLDLPGAVVGTAAGSLAANALIGALVAASGTEAAEKGARTFAVFSALGAAVLIGAAFDGQIGQTEGGLMLIAALVIAWLSAKNDLAASDELLKPRPLPGLGWLVAGAALVAGGSWLALGAVEGLAHGRPEGDLLAGLTALGLGAALPEIAAAVVAARKGEGGQALVNISTGVALVLFGAVGAAALVRPVRVSDAFLGVPALAVALGAVVLLGLALARKRLPRWAVGVGGLTYVVLIGVFVRSVA